MENIISTLVSVRMSDSDLKYLAEMCGNSGITIQNLFEVFVGDLVHGSYYSGSDESMLANEWFNRHGFSFMNKDSLLSHIVSSYGSYGVDDFLTAWDERLFFKDHPEEKAQHSLWYEEDINDFLDGYDHEVNEYDINSLRDWLTDYRSIYENIKEV